MYENVKKKKKMKKPEKAKNDPLKYEIIIKCKTKVSH